MAEQLLAVFVGPVARSLELTSLSGLSVGNDTFQDPNLYGFNEDQNVVAAPAGGFSPDVGSVIAAGTVVASHYIFFDPAGITSQEGYVDFDADILGIFTSTSTLAATDIYANTSVTYLSPTLRGLEFEDLSHY